MVGQTYEKVSYSQLLAMATDEATATTDGVMDCSLDLEVPVRPSSGGAVCCPQPSKDTEKRKSNDRWFSFDSSGQIYFVDKEDIDFSFDSDSFCSLDSDDSFSGDECSSVDLASPRANDTSFSSFRPAHRRQHSQASTDTIEMFHNEPPEPQTDSTTPPYIRLPSSISEGPHKKARHGVALPALPEDEPMISPEHSYIRDTKIPARGWFQSCRGCGCWTGARFASTDLQIPMCKRCQNKWDLFVAGHDVPLYNHDGRSDLLKQHAHYKLETCGMTTEGRIANRRDICHSALLEVHHAWVEHNGEPTANPTI